MSTYRSNYEQEREASRRKVKRRRILGLTVSLALLVLAGIVYFAVKAPADARYNRLFTASIVMAYDAPTFENAESYMMNVWNQMNKTFAGFDHASTYGTWWYPDQTYENSLAAQDDYFANLIWRLDRYEADYDRLRQNPGSIILTDWYDTAIQNFRVEMKREGGLDWGIRGAWYLTYAPVAYWSTEIIVVLAMCSFSAVLLSIISGVTIR